MEKIKSQIEALLFISGKSMSIKKIAEILKNDELEIVKAIEDLFNDYKEKNGGLGISINGDKVQMVTSGEVSQTIKDFIKDETTGELSRPSLETLTIIAYRGPVSKTDLDRIRGINCALILRNLLLRGLIEEKEERDEFFYNVSFDFLNFLGLNDIKELPDYERLSKDDCIDKILESQAEREQSSNE